MALKVDDRTLETTATTGTGSLNLAGAKTGFQTFVNGIGDTNTCPYLITDNADWEVGIGTVTSGAPDQISRDQVLASSNGDAKVNWGTGTKDVGVVAPAAYFGALAPDVRAISAAETLTIKDGGVVLLTSGALTQALPAGSAVFAGWGITVLIADGSTVTIDPNGAETINGASTYALVGQYRSAHVFWDGTEWKIGIAGLVPAPDQGDAAKFLTGAGTWSGQHAADVSARAKLSSAQAQAAANVIAQVNLDDDSTAPCFDLGADFDSSSGYAFVAPSAGVYSVSGWVTYNTAAVSKYVEAAIYVNGSIHVKGTRYAQGAATAASAVVSGIISLSASDSVELWARTSEVSGSVIDSSAVNTGLAIARIG